MFTTRVLTGLSLCLLFLLIAVAADSTGMANACDSSPCPEGTLCAVMDDFSDYECKCNYDAKLMEASDSDPKNPTCVDFCVGSGLECVPPSTCDTDAFNGVARCKCPPDAVNCTESGFSFDVHAGQNDLPDSTDVGTSNVIDSVIPSYSMWTPMAIIGLVALVVGLLMLLGVAMYYLRKYIYARGYAQHDKMIAHQSTMRSMSVSKSPQLPSRISDVVRPPSGASGSRLPARPSAVHGMSTEMAAARQKSPPQKAANAV